MLGYDKQWAIVHAFPIRLSYELMAKKKWQQLILSRATVSSIGLPLDCH